MSKPTFGRILAAYMVVCSLLAFLIPTHFAVEQFIPIDPSLIPVAGWLRHTPRALPFLTSYFFMLTALLPFVVVALAHHPQPKEGFHYEIPTFIQCVGATLVAICLFLLFAASAYGDLSVDGVGHGRGQAFFYLSATSRFGLAMGGSALMGAFAVDLYLTFVKLPRMWLGLRSGRFG